MSKKTSKYKITFVYESFSTTVNKLTTKDLEKTFNQLSDKDITTLQFYDDDKKKGFWAYKQNICEVRWEEE